MMILLLLAGALLCLSAALFFGPQLVAFGTDGLREALTRPEGRLVCACLVSAFVLLLVAPSASSILISGGKTVQVVAHIPTGLRVV